MATLFWIIILSSTNNYWGSQQQYTIKSVSSFAIQIPGPKKNCEAAKEELLKQYRGEIIAWCK